MPKFSPARIAELLAAARQDVDAIFDAWPYVLEVASAGRTDRPALAPNDDETMPASSGPVDPNLIRSRGEHSDPTANRAVNPHPAATWSSNARAAIVSLHRLAEQVRHAAA